MAIPGERMVHPVAEANEQSPFGRLTAEEFYARHGVAHSSSTFVNPQGLGIFTQRWVPGGGAPVLGAVAIVHGFTGKSSWMIQLTAVHFTKAGFAVDHQGYSFSEGLQGHIPDIGPVLDDCEAAFAPSALTTRRRCHASSMVLLPCGHKNLLLLADLDFSFLEMNPFTMVNGEPYPLDMRGELDDTAAFKNFKKWGNIEFPLPLEEFSTLKKVLSMNWMRRKVYLVGRRGPVQAACTAKELREILGLKNVRVCIKDADLVTSPADEEEMRNSRIQRRETYQISTFRRWFHSCCCPA